MEDDVHYILDQMKGLFCLTSQAVSSADLSLFLSFFSHVVRFRYDYSKESVKRVGAIIRNVMLAYQPVWK